MPHFRVGGQATAQALFQFVIRLRLSLVLTQMLAPRIHQEYFQVAIRCCGIAEDPPSIRSISTADAGIFMDCLHELRFPLRNNSVFDRNQHRSPVKVGPNLFDDNWRAPVRPNLTCSGVRGRFYSCTREAFKVVLLIDCISVGVDRMQRNFEPMRRQVEAWRRSEVTTSPPRWSSTRHLLTVNSILPNTWPAPHMTFTSNRSMRHSERGQSGVFRMRLHLHLKKWILSHSSRPPQSWANSWKLDSLSHSNPW
jgi:hypothetical protein